jgi:hypothetical protein
VNPRQRILSLLSGQIPDRVPWLADLDYWVTAMQQRGQVAPDYKTTQAYYDLHRELGIGYYLQGLWPFRTAYAETVEVKVDQDGNRRRTTVTTPVGTITNLWTYLPESFSEAPSEHYVKEPEDLRVLRYLYEHTSYEPEFAELLRRKPMIGDNGVVLAYLPRSPFMEMVTSLVGIRTMVHLWMDAPGELEDTLRVIEGKHDQAAAIALQAPAECLMIPENLSSEVVGKRFYNRFMLDYECRWVSRIRQAGKFSFIHMDGTLRGLLREVSQAGFDVVEAATPAPVGDLDFEAMRALAGPGTILWGGVPGVYFTDLVDEAEFDRLVIDVLSVMRRQPRYVLGVADQVPPGGLRRRVARVAELVERYGKYDR